MRCEACDLVRLEPLPTPEEQARRHHEYLPEAPLDEREFEYTDEEFAGDSLEYVKKAITREVMSKNFGRKEMYHVLLQYDSEFQEVLRIFKVAPSLDDMFVYGEEQRNLKKASLK